MEFIPLKEVTVRPADERLRRLGGEWGCITLLCAGRHCSPC